MLERGLASFDIYVIVTELQELVGSYIDKIFQISRDEIILRVKNPDTNKKETLYIHNNELLCRTDTQFTALVKPPSFTMTLRKHILNGKIHAITQHEFDRIIKITIQKKEEQYLLILELFKNGNIILVNSQGIIIHSLLTQHWAQRTIKPHEPYQPPPSQKNPFTLDSSTFHELLKTSKRDIVRTLAVTLNLSGTYAEELCTRAQINKNTTIKELDEKTITQLYTTLTSFLEQFNNKEFHPVYIKQEEDLIDLLPFPFLSYQNKEVVPLDSFSRGLELFIKKKITPKQQKNTEQQKIIEKLQRQLQQQTQSIEEFTALIKQRQQEGDLIYLHLQQCQALLDDISQVLKQKEKDDEIQRINQNPLVKTFDPLSDTLHIILPSTNGEIKELIIDFRKTAVENAQNAYEDSKKYKEKIDGAEKAIQATKNAIQRLQEKTLMSTPETQDEQESKGKRFWFEQYHWFLSSEGNVVVAGRDAKSNDVLVKKYLKENDRYVHADVHGAASCVVKNTDIHGDLLLISDETLQEACVFAACFSKAWKQFGEAQVYWVLPEQVSKTPQSGEFLPRGAFVIRGKRNYVRCTLELAVGEIMVDGMRRVMAGPVSAVKDCSQKYVVIQSGAMKSSSLARMLAKVFSVSVDDVLRVLPPGNVQVKRTIGFELSGTG
ncbi:MAG: ribosome rescue protein RqcH [Methanobacteriota archaeon]